MRTLLLLPVVLCGCAVTSPPFQPVVGAPEFRNWCRAALSEGSHRADHAQFRAAYRGDAVTVRKYFLEAHNLEMTPKMAPAAEMSLQWTLETLLYRLGDRRFSTLLRQEPAEVRAAVTHFLRAETLGTTFGETKSVLDAAAKIDFPMEQAYRRDQAL